MGKRGPKAGVITAAQEASIMDSLMGGKPKTQIAAATGISRNRINRFLKARGIGRVRIKK